jgi:hypothetical protein
MYWEFFEEDFVNQPEELKRAVAIYWILLHRIYVEVFPFIEWVISHNIKTLGILPKKLNVGKDLGKI